MITVKRKLQRMLEPRAPRPSLRLRALQHLSSAGIRCNLLMMPMVPGLTDDASAIESVIRAGSKAGATGIWWRSLFLKPAAAKRFIPFIQANYPEASERIKLFYERATYAPAAYDEYLRGIFDHLRRKYGYDPALVRGEEMSAGDKSSAHKPPPQQLSLLSSQSKLARK